MIQFSVIIPLYNKADTILGAINSIFNQTYKPFEIIIINDGSTDNSKEIVESIKNPLIKLFNKKNEGVSITRNFGIHKANCEFIAFLDADDEWLPNFLDEISKLINTFPSAIGYGTSYLMKNSFNITEEIKLNKIKFQDDIGLIDNYIEVCNFSSPPIWTSALCVKKDVIISVRGFPEGINYGEDLLTWVKLSIIGDFAFSKKTLAIYNLSEFNPKFNPPQIPDKVSIEFEKIYKLVKDKKNFKIYIGKWHKMRAALFLISGFKKNAIIEIIKSLKFYGFNYKLILYLILSLFPKKIIFKILFR